MDIQFDEKLCYITIICIGPEVPGEVYAEGDRSAALPRGGREHHQGTVRQMESSAHGQTAKEERKP